MDQIKYVDARYYSVKEKGRECGEFVPGVSDPLKIAKGLTEVGEMIGGVNGRSLVERFGPFYKALNGIGVERE